MYLRYRFLAIDGQIQWVQVRRATQYETTTPMNAKPIIGFMGITGSRKKATLFTRTAHPQQWDTPAFKAWFSGSKVVDAQGNPLVVFHGTAHDFDVFDMAKQNSNYGKSYRFDGREGFFFTNSPQEAEDVAGWSAAYLRPPVSGTPGLKGENLKPVYLSIQNPYVRKSGGEWTQLWYDRQWKDIQAKVKSKGYDGVIIIGTGKAANHVMYAVFSPNQIKSAIGNSGGFNPEDPKITASHKTALGDVNFELAMPPVDPRRERMDDPEFDTGDGRVQEPHKVQATLFNSKAIITTEVDHDGTRKEGSQRSHSGYVYAMERRDPCMQDTGRVLGYPRSSDDTRRVGSSSGQTPLPAFP